MKQDKQVIALGFFDGVHQGHGALLQRVLALGGNPAVLTFDEHPSTYLEGESVPLITGVEDRCYAISHYYSIDHIIVCSFSEIMGMEWQDFVTNFLVNTHQVKHIVAGHDFHFGRGGVGTPAKLKELCSQIGIGCDIIDPVKKEGIVVSSTHIRSLIAQGEMEKVTDFLGHPHMLSNQVVHGNKIGKTQLGYPTVNLKIPDHVIVPAFGVYACRIYVGEEVFLGATNVGIRPTVADSSKNNLSVETFLLDFEDKELYGTNIRVEFHSFIRPEQKFASFTELSAQIARDVSSTRHFFNK